MNTEYEETTRATREFPVLGRGEIYSFPKRKKIFWFCMVWAATLMLVLCTYGLYSYFRYGQKEEVSVSRNGQYQASIEEMIRKDFPK